MTNISANEKLISRHPRANRRGYIFTAYLFFLLTGNVQDDFSSINDDIAKSPYAALRFISCHCDLRKSRPHSSRFARLASGAFFDIV
jgi:hypothetical protein